MSSKSETSPPRLSAGELEIMNEVWDRQPVTVRSLTEAVNASRGEALSRTTILKTIQRLEEKGWLTRDAGRPALYRASRAQKETKGSLLRNFRDLVFDGSAVSLVRCLLDSSRLRPEEIEELQRMIDRERKEAP